MRLTTCGSLARSGPRTCSSLSTSALRLRNSDRIAKRWRQLRSNWRYRTSSPATASSRLLRAVAGDYPAAIEAYEHVLPLFLSDWGKLEQPWKHPPFAGDPDGAVEALRQAAALVADAPPVRLNFANALVEAGKAEEAEAEFKAMARDFPADWRALRELHVLLRSLAREDEALEQSRKRAGAIPTISTSSSPLPVSACSCSTMRARRSLW